MKAIMLAAGEGTRCYPFTHLSPKMFQQIGGIPLLEYMLSWFGGTPRIDKLYIVVRGAVAAETLSNYVQKRKPYISDIQALFATLGLEVCYTNPDLQIEILRAKGWGTGGDLRLTLNQILPDGDPGEDLLVCNSDYVIVRRLPDGRLSPQLNLTEMIEYHQACRRTLKTVMTMSIVPVKREEATRFGVVQTEESDGFRLVHRFMEKPPLEDIPHQPWVNAGVYVIDSAFIVSHLDEVLPEQPNTVLEKTLLERLANSGKHQLAGYPLDLEAWYDIGTLHQIIDANIRILTWSRVHGLPG